MEEKPEVTGGKRNEKGQFVPGISGNPDGRPKGSLSITAEIKKKLEEIPEGKDKTYLAYLVEQIIKKGVIDGNDRTIQQLWAYVDGMPKQSVELSGDKENPVRIIEISVANGEDKDNLPS